MRDNHLPLEERIGSVRDGDTTDHGTPIGSTPLAVQPSRRLAVGDIKQECANCRFSAWGDHDEFDNYLDCRRHAPIASRSVVTGWPVVFIGDWCGDWEARHG